MYCSNCGKENNKLNKFCFNCGNQLNIEEINKNNKSGYEETSLVLGIICLVSSFVVNIFCFIPGIISLVFARKYKKESGKLGAGFGLSLAGMIFSFIVLILGILLFVFILNVGNNVIENNSNYDTNYVSREFTEGLPYV